MGSAKRAGMARVTGIGGVFLRSRSPEALGAWYRENLGLPYEDGAASLPFLELDGSEGRAVWATFEAETDYFGSDSQQVMINYRVDDLEALLAVLRARGVTIAPERHNDENGRFAWIIDPDGNRIELWEPPQPPPAA